MWIANSRIRIIILIFEPFMNVKIKITTLINGNANYGNTSSKSTEAAITIT